jgi:diguanylate cyclase (GGDEF)-like protein
MVENAISSKTSHFFEILDFEFHRAMRYKIAITLMFIKLCHLDDIVREHGQVTADGMISEIERLIRSNIRRTDKGFMYGKDEFMIILPNTPKDGAHSMIPKLQRLIESCHQNNQRGASVQLTPKFGIASYMHNSESKGGLAKLAESVSEIYSMNMESSPRLERQVV